MLKHAEIERLAEFDAKNSRVLSVYLDLDPSAQVRRAYRIAFEDLVADVRRRQSEAALPQFSDEVARVQTFLETEPPRGKGLAAPLHRRRRFERLILGGGPRRRPPSYGACCRACWPIAWWS